MEILLNSSQAGPNSILSIRVQILVDTYHPYLVHECVCVWTWVMGLALGFWHSCSPILLRLTWYIHILTIGINELARLPLLKKNGDIWWAHKGLWKRIEGERKQNILRRERVQRGCPNLWVVNANHVSLIIHGRMPSIRTNAEMRGNRN